MAPEDFIATGNPAWLLVADEQTDDVAGDLAVEATRHGPATVASVILQLDNAEAGTELTLGDVLAAIKALEAIAAQAVIDGYGIPNTFAAGQPWLREDALDIGSGGPFSEYYYARVGEIENAKAFGAGDEGSSVEMIDGRQSFDEDAYDRIFWTLYGVREDNDQSEALYDADTEDEVARIAALLPGVVYRDDDGVRTLVKGS